MSTYKVEKENKEGPKRKSGVGGVPQLKINGITERG
jgi:hypothetical protein